MACPAELPTAGERSIFPAESDQIPSRPPALSAPPENLF
jgi:hypothetical protein